MNAFEKDNIIFLSFFFLNTVFKQLAVLNQYKVGIRHPQP